MNTEEILLRLDAGPVTLSKDEAKAVRERVNFLESFVASLLTLIKRKRRLVDVSIPLRSQAL